jgi:hypothetical protein
VVGREPPPHLVDDDQDDRQADEHRVACRGDRANALESTQAGKKATHRRPLFPCFGSGSAMPAMNIATRAGLKTTSGSIKAPRVGSRSEKGAYRSRTSHESAYVRMKKAGT